MHLNLQKKVLVADLVNDQRSSCAVGKCSFLPRCGVWGSSVGIQDPRFFIAEVVLRFRVNLLHHKACKVVLWQPLLNRSRKQIVLAAFSCNKFTHNLQFQLI